MSEVETEDAEEGKGGILKILLIVILALMLVAGSILGTLFYVGFFEEKSADQDPEMTLQEMEAEMEDTDAALGVSPGPMSADIEQKFLISYYNFTDPFTVNVNGSKKVLQVKIGISTYHDKDTLFNDEEGTEGWVPRHLIGIRAQILKVLRSVRLEKLQALDGQDNLLEEIKLVINETLEKYEKTTASPIEEAYFSEFIVQ
ncbi:MAG: flagellar basal body-associated FliL family protein [Pseudomonadales bacterium]|nr:flagellar basal body-associated FliL family protein [Pseudomonadales bacterium]